MEMRFERYAVEGSLWKVRYGGEICYGNGITGVYAVVGKSGHFLFWPGAWAGAKGKGTGL